MTLWRRLLYLCTLFLCATMTLVARADDNAAPIVLGVENSWPPYADAMGQGISTDIVRAAFAAVNQPVEIRVRPYARVLREVSAGLLSGGYNVTRQSTTEQRFVFGKSPLLMASASVYYAPDHVADYQSHSQWPDNLRIGVIIGYEYGDAYERHRHRFKEYRVNHQQQLVRMLLAGRIDIAILFDRVAQYTLAEMGLSEDQLVRGMDNHFSDIYVVFSREDPNALRNADLLDAGLKRIKDQGAYADIIQ